MDDKQVTSILGAFRGQGADGAQEPEDTSSLFKNPDGTVSPTNQPEVKRPAGSPEEPPDPWTNVADSFAPLGLKQPDVSPQPVATRPIESPQRLPEDDVTGFWSGLKTGLLRGTLESTANAAASAGALLPGQTLQRAAEALPSPTPAAMSEFETLKNTGVFDGWTNSKWWGVQLGHGLGGSAPAIALGAVGGVGGELAAGPPGAMVGGAGGFALGSALQTLAPAMRKALDAGEDVDAAWDRAVVESGIDAAFGAAMGLAPGVNVYGRETISGALKRPLLEAMTQLGIIQPVLGVANLQAKAGIVDKRFISPDEAVTGLVVGAAMGSGFMGAHMVPKAVERVINPPAPPPTPKAIENVQRGLPGMDVVPPSDIAPKESAGFGPAKPAAPFYSQVLRVLTDKGPESAKGSEWRALFENHPTIRKEELDQLELPYYLTLGRDEKISKNELRQYIEGNQVEIIERVRMNTTDFVRNPNDPYQQIPFEREDLYEPYTLPGARDGYREDLFAYVGKGEVLERADIDMAPIEKTLDQMMRTTGGSIEEGRKLRGIQQAINARSKAWADKVTKAPSTSEESHFGPYEGKDVFAHARSTSRRDRDGNRVHLIEEVQSMLHQAARESGYEGRDMSHRDLQRAYTDIQLGFHNALMRAQIRHPEAPHRTLDYHDYMGRHLSGPTYRDEWLPTPLKHQLNAMREAYRKLPDRDENYREPDQQPNAPFKSNWAELVFKKMLAVAIESGHDRLAWASGDAVIRAQGQGMSDRQRKGIKQFYDSELTKIAESWAKRLGMRVGELTLNTVERPDRYQFKESVHGQGVTIYDTERAGPPGNQAVAHVYDTNEARAWIAERTGGAEQRVRYIELTPAASERVRLGFPLYSKAAGVHLSEGPRAVNELADIRVAGRKIANGIREVARRMKIDNIPINVHLEHQPTGNRLGEFSRDKDGYHIRLNLARHRTPQELYATASHEFGHIVQVEVFDKAPVEHQLLLASDYENWLNTTGANRKHLEVVALRDNAITTLYGTRGIDEKTPFLALTDAQKQYWLSQEEYLAEQVARWMTTSEKPLTIVDKFYKGIASKVRDAIETFRKWIGLDPNPSSYVQQWLDALVDGKPWLPDVRAASDLRSFQQAHFQWEREGVKNYPVTPQDPSTNIMRELVRRVTGSQNSLGAGATASGADRMAKGAATMLSMPQIAKLNPHLLPLQNYKETNGLLHLEKTEIHNRALQTLTELQSLPYAEKEGLFGLIEDYMLNKHLSPGEVTAKIERRPTVPELTKMINDNKVSDRAFKLFDRIRGDFDHIIDLHIANLRREASRIGDFVKREQRMLDIAENEKALKNKAFFPFLHFGEFQITIRGPDGTIKHYETTTSAKKQRQIIAHLESRMDPGDTINGNKIDKTATPFQGMPSSLLDSMMDKLDLDADQRRAAENMRFELSPVQSFKHRLQGTAKVPGFSTEYTRVYANFMFHAANHVTRVKYADQLRSYVREVRDMSRAETDPTAGNKKSDIANYMGQHFQYIMDPKPDFAVLRSMMFHWVLGFNPAAATLNLTQTILGTYPFLSSKFGAPLIGDARAVAAMARASKSFENLFRLNKVTDMKGPEFKMIGEAVREGIVTEAMAPMLAATSEGRNLSKGFGGNALEQAWNTYSKFSSGLFETTERINRLVAFHAAVDLAMRYPDTKYVQEIAAQNPIQFQRLKDKGWSDQEARAFIAGKDAVESTQYVYAPYARARFMQGKAGVFFIFKAFTQNTLFYLWNYPSAAVRTLLLMAGMGGLMGLPGAEDINGIARAIGYHIFGKDWDIEDEIRKFVVGVLKGGGGVESPGDIRTKEGGIRPDILLHGLSRVGFGFPQIADTLGELVGLGRMGVPVFDRSRSIGMGNLLPIEPGPTFAPDITGLGAGGHDTAQSQLHQIERASGVVGSLASGIFHMLTSSQTSAKDLRFWEKMVPKYAANASKAYRFYSEEGERSRPGGPRIVKFDPHDTTHMAELIGQSLGYMPERRSASWDLIKAQKEASAFWDVRRELLLRQAWAARGDQEAYQRVMGAVRAYNEQLPDNAKTKALTPQVIINSFKNRGKATTKLEAGVPLKKTDIPVQSAIKRLYPEADIQSEQKVR